MNINEAIVATAKKQKECRLSFAKYLFLGILFIIALPVGGGFAVGHLFENRLAPLFFIIIYISNRYSVQKDLIEIDRLQTELSDAKYRALSSSSQLTERSRESHVLEILKTNKDSILKIPSRPPFIINVPAK